MHAHPQLIPGVDPKLLIKDAAKADAGSDAPLVPARRREPRRADVPDRLRHRRQRRRRKRAAQDFEFNDRVQAWLFNPNRLAPTYPESAITGRSRSTPITARTRRPTSTATTTSSKSAAWSTTRSRGRWTSFTRCRRSRRSPAISASKAGARSANGPACGCREFLKRDRRRHHAPNMSGSDAPRAIRHTIDMPTALHPQTQMTFKFDDEIIAARVRLPDEDAACRPSSASRTRSTSWRCTSPTTTPAATGKTRATTGTAGCSLRRRHERLATCPGRRRRSTARRLSLAPSQCMLCRNPGRHATAAPDFGSAPPAPESTVSEAY